MSRYRISSPARRDLRDIYCYISERSPAGAGRVRQVFLDKFRLLSRNPLLGERRSEFGADMRSFTAGRYVIFYRPVPGGISVARVIHSARDIFDAWRE